MMRALPCLLLLLAAESVVPTAAPGERVQATADAASVIACIQNALGGTAAFAAVSSLYIEGDTRPLQTSGLRPLAGTRVISVVFPDRYRRDDLGRPRRPGEAGLNSTVGFDRRVILSNPQGPDAARNEHLAHWDFARAMLMRLPGRSIGVQLSQHLRRDDDHEMIAVNASRTGGFRATLLADRSTCQPVALEYVTAGAAAGGLARVELLEYRSFGGIRFPTLLTTSVAGQPYHEERVTTVEVNTPAAARAFAARR